LIANFPRAARSHGRHPPRAAASLPTSDDLTFAAAMLHALGDPERLRILIRLGKGELCVSELAELEEEKLTTVSARLKLLFAVRLVARRRDAKHIYYALADDHVLRLIQSAIDHAAEKR
jgi:ArsR family transcriptional regulator, lead/cadmium/zinc/bismuth-responsive transcriptional repressor